MIKLGVTLANALLATGSFKSLMDGGFIYAYSGPVPASGDAAVDASCVMLGKFTAAAGAGLTWDGAPANGVIQKTAAETWSTTVGTTGVPTFFRACVGADTGAGAAGAGNYRIQGTIGTDLSSDMVLNSTNWVAGDTKTLSSAQFSLPT